MAAMTSINGIFLYREKTIESYVALTSTLGGGRPAMSPLVSSLQYNFIINVYH
jgi:hypothetical protein